MAENIVAGLFGLDPYQIQQQRQAQFDAQAKDMAGMGGFELAGYLGGKAGAGLGKIGAGMLGMVDPMEERARVQQQAMQGADTQTPEGLRALAARLQSLNMPQQAMIAAAKANEIEQLKQEMDLKNAQTKQALAHAKYYEQGGAAGGQSQLSAKQAIAYNNALKYYLDLNYPPDQARQLATQEAEKIGEFFNKPQIGTQAPVIPVSSRGITTATLPDQSQMTKEDMLIIRQDALASGDVNTVQRIDAMLRSASIPQTTKAQAAGTIQEAKTRAENIPSVLAGGAGAKEAGKTGVEIWTKQYHAADSADKVVQKTNDLIDQLQTGDVTTGIGADLRIGISRMQSLLGGKNGAKNATDSQIADVMMGSEVFPLIQSLGIGAKGMDTPAEREFLRKVLTGELSLEKGTLIKMAELRKESAQKDIDKWNKNVDEGNLDKYFENVGIPKIKFGQNINKKQTSDASYKKLKTPPTDAEINATALKYKITPAEVRRRLGLQ